MAIPCRAYELFWVQVFLDSLDRNILHIVLTDPANQTQIHMETGEEIRLIDLLPAQYSLVSRMNSYFQTQCQYTDMFVLDPQNQRKHTLKIQPHTTHRFRNFATVWLYGKDPCVADIQFDFSTLTRIFVKCEQESQKIFC